MPETDINETAPSPKYPNRVRQLRKAAGMSSKLVAERAGIPLPTYFGLERGKLPLTAERAMALAPILNAKDPRDLSPGPLVPAAALASRAGKAKPKRPEADQLLIDSDDLVKLCLSIPKRRRRLAADLIRVLLRAWE
jgi:transcriptional regulator with XRE-family HTH domain